MATEDNSICVECGMGGCLRSYLFMMFRARSLRFEQIEMLQVYDKSLIDVLDQCGSRCIDTRHEFMTCKNSTMTLIIFILSKLIEIYLE